MVVYTSYDNFKCDKCVVKFFNEIKEEQRDWVIETTEELLSKRNIYERKAARELKKSYPDTIEQVYFMIDGHSYFLDFYIPSIRVAVEIDGESHKDRVKKDALRDKLFSKIGIKTIRLLNEKVKDNNTVYLLNESNKKKPIQKRTSNKKPKQKKNKKTKWQKTVASAYREIMKYKGRVGKEELKKVKQLL